MIEYSIEFRASLPFDLWALFDEVHKLKSNLQCGLFITEERNYTSLANLVESVSESDKEVLDSITVNGSAYVVAWFWPEDGDVAMPDFLKIHVFNHGQSETELESLFQEAKELWANAFKSLRVEVEISTFKRVPIAA